MEVAVARAPTAHLLQKKREHGLRPAVRGGGRRGVQAVEELAAHWQAGKEGVGQRREGLEHTQRGLEEVPHAL